MMTILLTGFGPFPGMPFNPTEPLVARLARIRRPALAGVTLVTHVFPTSYAAVDRDLPNLIARHRPDAMLMFGVAGRTRHLRIEMRARNARSLLIPDAARSRSTTSVIAAGAPATLVLHGRGARLLAAARTSRVPAALSRDAGRYLCNYLCWRAVEATGDRNGPQLVAFVHVPKLRRDVCRPDDAKRRSLTSDDLVRAGEAILLEIASAVRRH
jgi:pyroglutamyl-peptidase